jgi:hypothetical protein
LEFGAKPLGDLGLAEWDCRAALTSRTELTPFTFVLARLTSVSRSNLKAANKIAAVRSQ